ncbi:hypothetical protein EVAR_75649_1 [Eumeta japonica]|uniref:Uncharacterized protein n=1 Tax=Eumeta variegata TaxID=151549 RepID=A0A4C1U0B5_EUMVA|nr:hypothetical protein EVAR_75649_1 [Eumeta japonica]
MSIILAQFTSAPESTKSCTLPFFTATKPTYTLAVFTWQVALSDSGCPSHHSPPSPEFEVAQILLEVEFTLSSVGQLDANFVSSVPRNVAREASVLARCGGWGILFVSRLHRQVISSFPIFFVDLFIVRNS